MMTSKIWRGLLATVIFGAFGALVFIGCQGSTENNTNTLGDQFVSDGGAGASLSIEIMGDLNVADTIGFFVTALDPRGAPLAFARIFCESEKGIAIIEPSSGGVGFEHTGPDGRMSGVLGGLLPGSFILECRAPLGYNLIARKSIHVLGDVPQGFAGFPGAAGGNLGGGVIVDTTSDVNADNAVQLTSITFSDASGETSEIDSALIADCGDGTQEPFRSTTMTVNVDNNTTLQLIIDSVVVDVDDPANTNPAVSASITATIDASSASGINVTFIRAGVASGALTAFEYSASGDTPTAGTFTATVTVSGHDPSGNDFDVTSSVSYTITPMNNCSASTTSTSTSTSTT